MNKDIVEVIASDILGMRDLLYADIIYYKDYQKVIKDYAKKYKLKYKFTGTINSLSEKTYKHILSNKEKNINVVMPVDELFIDFNLEKF